MLTGCAILCSLRAGLGVCGVKKSMCLWFVSISPLPLYSCAHFLPPPLLYIRTEWIACGGQSPSYGNKSDWLRGLTRKFTTQTHARTRGKNREKCAQNQPSVCAWGPHLPSANNGEKIRNKNKGCVCALLWFRVTVSLLPCVALRYVHTCVRVIERCVTDTLALR